MCLRPVLFVAVGFGRCLGWHSIGGFLCVFEASSICSSGIWPLLRKSLYIVCFLCLRPVLFVAVGFGRCLGRHSIEFVFLCLRPVLFVAVGFGRFLGRHSMGG